MCFYCVWKYLENTVMIAVRSRYFNEVMFLLLVILQHGMRRLALMVNDVNSFTDRHHQC